MLSTRFRVSLCLALVVLTALISSGLSFAPTATAAEPEGKLAALARVMAIQDRNTARMMAKENVVGTATGLNAAGRPVIKVFTAKPGVRGIAAKLEDVPVIVEVTGEFFALGDTTARWPRPVPIGVSTGHPAITAGTIGCRVTDGTDVFALSNNHIYANENMGIIGDNVLQPGPYDGGEDTDYYYLGMLADFQPIVFTRKAKNEIDAAIARSSTDNLGTATPEIGGYGTPNSTIVGAFIGQQVQKFGRTTELTKGEITGINATVNVGYAPGKTARFVKQIIIGPGGFSDGGDSGSLIVTDDDNRNPVGLLFAGSSTMTVANQIGLVLDRFGVTVDDSQPGNSPPTAEFTYTTSDLTVNFTDQSSDSDGSVVAWSWDFGDNNTSTAQNPGHTYSAAGTYTVTLTVTDDGGATGSTSIPITVVSPAADTVTITKAEYKARNGELKVEATSTFAPTAQLTVEGYGEMSYDARKNLYKFIQSGAADPDGSVTVISDFGGSATKTVKYR